MEVYVRRAQGETKFLIDDEDYYLLVDRTKVVVTGYLVIRKNINKKTYQGYFHRIVMNCPKDMQVDHINHDKTDNRKQNLRICTWQQNMQNCRGKNLKMKAEKGLKYKGITWIRRDWKWGAQCKDRNKRQVNLGYFETQEEAARAYDRFAAQEHGEFACLNFPNELK